MSRRVWLLPTRAKAAFRHVSKQPAQTGGVRKRLLFSMGVIPTVIDSPSFQTSDARRVYSQNEQP